MAGETYMRDDDRRLAEWNGDNTKDGKFLFSLRTKDVYHGPSSGARLQRREIVGFRTDGVARGVRVLAGLDRP